MDTFLVYLIIGIVTGALYSIAAAGLVLTYATSRVFNFAHGAIGMLLAYVAYTLWVQHGLNEWLSLAMTKDELREEWMQNAAAALASMILENQDSAIDSGALYHAVHGLYIYRQRVFGVPGPARLGMPLLPGQ